MFKKVLVAEDLGDIAIGISKVLDGLNIPEVMYTKYCDDAYLKVKKAIYDEQPFELLVCDLSFKQDHRNEVLASGQELIEAVKKYQPFIKIIVYSVETHPQTVKMLWDSELIDAYVCKDRESALELEEAVVKVYQGENFFSPQLKNVLRNDNIVMLKEYEVKLLEYLANGLTQDEIEREFKKEGISPSSKSSIEKRLKDLKEAFNVNNTHHLIAILKDLRLI